MINKENNRILELRKLIHRYNYEYYVNSSSSISDFEFDQLLKELEDLESQFPELNDPNSPTKRVGGDITKSFETVNHQYPMLSLANSYSKEDIIDFDTRIRKIIDVPFSYICELKYDGVAISLVYENGQLLRAVTRGDGIQGEEVTNNVRTISSIPLILSGNPPKKLEVRGEIMFSKAAFLKLNNQRKKEELPLFSNPRNTASGTLKLQDSSLVAQRDLDCFLYAAFLENSAIEKVFDHYQFLTDLGFKTPFKGDNLPFEIDGIVIKINEISLQNEIGNTTKSPRWAIAYKYKATQVTTHLENIIYQVGRTGAITPVAVLKPVEISGTIVRRASVHNADQIEKLDLRLNDVVYVEKGGEIIPKITAVDLSKRKKDSIPFNFIERCPECDSELERDQGEAHHYCFNNNSCPPQIKGKITHFIGRKQMNIEGIGEETVEQLFNAGLINNIADLYSLKKEKMLPLERMAEKSVDNILIGIENSKTAPFHKILFGLGIRYVGETVAKKLTSVYSHINDLRSATFEELCLVDEIGEKIAESIVAYFKVELHHQIIDQLLDSGLKMESQVIKKKNQSNILANKKIVISGTFKNISRENLKNLIEEKGGKNTSSVSKSTDILVAGENMGPSKLEKAEKFKVEILSEEEFLILIQNLANEEVSKQFKQGKLF